MRTRLGVLGWPVAHSRSPAIHNAALSAVGLTDWRYQLLPVPPELFAQTVRALPGSGFRGANVTIPHKEAALRLADSRSDRARAIGAANTLVFGDAGQIHADNTDAPALIELLPFAAVGRSALVLGAGGSARACAWALINAGFGEVRVWSRNPQRARTLCDELGCVPVVDARPADVLINCTPVGLDESERDFKQLPVAADQLKTYEYVVDLVYRATETPLAQAARAQSIPVIDGLEVLLRQGALSFEQFTGLRAPVDAMRAAVRPG